jgi:hypothetical protein
LRGEGRREEMIEMMDEREMGSSLGTTLKKVGGIAKAVLK